MTRGVLIDSHILIYLLQNPEKLKKSQLELILNPEIRIFLSIASIWEIEIKRIKFKKDKLSDIDLMKGIEELGLNIEILPIVYEDIANLKSLKPDIHNDPFDHMLISQALNNNLLLITNDKLVKKYFE